MNCVFDFSIFVPGEILPDITDSREQILALTAQSFVITVQNSKVKYSIVQYSTVWYTTVQYITVQYSSHSHFSSSFLNSHEPSQNKETKVQYSMSLYHAVMYCTKGVRRQKVPRVY